MTGYSTLWTSISFYLPQDTTAAKRRARRFLRELAKMGGTKSNLVISRGRGAGLICVNYAKALTLEACLPADAELRLVPVTDKQVEHSRVFWGKRRASPDVGTVNG